MDSVTKVRLANYRIVGRKKGERGGALMGFRKDNGQPGFGGSNLIYALIWWDTTQEAVQAFCDKIISDFPEYECKPEFLGY